MSINDKENINNATKLHAVDDEQFLSELICDHKECGSMNNKCELFQFVFCRTQLIKNEYRELKAWTSPRTEIIFHMFLNKGVSALPDLEKSLLCSNPSLNNHLRQMEHEGLIGRCRSGSDRRKKMIFLTDNGLKLIINIISASFDLNKLSKCKLYSLVDLP